MSAEVTDLMAFRDLRVWMRIKPWRRVGAHIWCGSCMSHEPLTVDPTVHPMSESGDVNCVGCGDPRSDWPTRKELNDKERT